MSRVDAKEVTILRLGAEGADLDLVGVKDHSGWRFQVRTDGSTLLSLLTEEDAAGLSPTNAGAWVRSWHEALEQLETECRSWRDLLPLHVEPAFRTQIAEAFRAGTTRRHFNDREWATLLSDPRIARSERTLGAHPVTGEPIVAAIGRFGAYVKHGKSYANIPTGKTPDTNSLEEAVIVLDANAKRLGRLSKLRRSRKDVGRGRADQLRLRRQ
jgi:hypothetical protein